ncbi:MAG: dihydroneopterin triphosphate diphosphatase [Zoogloeaceae bacterium]|jgi:dATP pyrophosphohydrolase|nr:dihydroneopterin triphosphate diphosphatase [Zoogloeaceae bacterium]
MYKSPVSVLVVIHTRNLDFLLLERAAHPGYWQSVTGSREAGERLAETARREVWEETGIAAEPGALRDWRQSRIYEILPEWRSRYAPGVAHNTEHLFSLCLPNRPFIRLAPAEHRDSLWLPAAEAAARCFSQSNREAICLVMEDEKQ